MNRVIHKALSSAKLPLIVAHDTDGVTDVRLRRYRDVKAGQSILINATHAPFSPITGNPLKPELKNTITIKASDVKNLVPFGQNKDLGVVYRTLPEIAKQINGKGAEFFCTVSSEKIPVKVNQRALAAALAADVSEDAPEDEIPTDFNFEDDQSLGDEGDEILDLGGIGDETPDAAAFAENQADPVGDAAVAPITDDDLNLGNDEEIAPEAAPAAAEDTPPPPPAAPADVAPAEDTPPAPVESDPAAAEQPVVDPTEDEAPAEALDDIESINNHMTNDTSVASFRLNLMEQVASQKDVRFDALLTGGDSPVWYIMANHRPVAIAAKDKAADGVKAIFTNVAKFQQVFADSVKNGITEEVAADFGLQPIHIEVKASEVLASRVSSEVKKATQKVEAQRQELDRTFRQSLSIAAVAINKGFYKDVPNPVRSKLCEELASLNVRNPEKIVDKVFASHGEDYLRMIMERAFALSNESHETRETVARLVEEASYQPMNVDASVRATSRLTGGNTPHIAEASTDVPVALASAPDQVSAMRQKLGLSKRR